jgi:hypothetical protein
MRHSESGKKIFKRKRKKGAQLQKKKENAIIAARKDISLKSADCLKLITRRRTILKKNENEGLRKSLN